MSKALPLSRPIETSAIPAAGLERTITSDAGQRAAIAEAYDIPEVRALAAEFSVEREAGGVIRVKGRVTAEIVQSCVVSLDPVEQSIDEAIDIRLVEPGSRRAQAAPRPGAELLTDPGEADPPDVLNEPTLDLGAIAVEHFLLAVDPYPRAPGAELPADVADAPADVPDSPFAVLARLRGGSG
jgi:uncharacterized metal-binding protein YceD (DUF177 family)